MHNKSRVASLSPRASPGRATSHADYTPPGAFREFPAGMLLAIHHIHAALTRGLACGYNRRMASRSGWRLTLAVILLSRFALNLQSRIVYPFLPAIGRGLGVPLETASLLLTVRALAGMTSPIFGILADRRGRWASMIGGLAALALGAALVGVAPSFSLALGAFVLLGLSKASYDPGSQAYIGDAVPYEERGRVMGILELPWSLAWLIGVPVAGFLIARLGWRAPFWGIAGLGVLSLLATWLACTQCSRSPARQRPPSRIQFTKSTMMALLVSGLLTTANESVFVVYGAWMESQFGLTIAALGLASMVIAVAELAAEAFSAGLVDRFGKRRAVLGGLALGAIAYFVLPLLARNLGSALLGITLVVLTFEFTIVSMLPLVSELAPDARGTLMAVNVAAMSFGRMVGSLCGPRLWSQRGLRANAVVAGGLVLVALLILGLSVREKST
jgi:predicted MFS family arabinose efflux permease